MTPRIVPAAAADLDDISALLERSALPPDGFADHLATAFVARDAGTLVGVAALELHDSHGLLRSVAVDRAARGRGLGQALAARAIEAAGDRGLEAVYLLTDTAAGFFPRLGFRELPRAQVPASVRQSIQFTLIRCASAKAMVLTLQSGVPGVI